MDGMPSKTAASIALLGVLTLLGLSGCGGGWKHVGAAQGGNMETSGKQGGTKDDEWKKKLSPEQYQVLRQCGTEAPFTGKYWDNHEPGIYVCAGCGQTLFYSGDKFDSGSGWPSYTRPADATAVSIRVDTSLGMKRVELLCSKCGGHLGHVFEDGPQPTGRRYCINSASLDFKEKK